MLHDALIAPFTEFEFMRRALAAVIALSLGARADRRVPDAAADEPRRRRHGACDPAGRRDRLSGLGAQSVRDDHRRPDRGLYGRDPGRRGRAHHRAEGRRLARDLLSGVAGARRHHRFHQGHQYRPAARAVRQHPGDGRPDPAGDRLQRHHHAAGAGGDLSPAGDRMRRSGVPAHREPRRRAGASGVPGAGRRSTSSTAFTRSARCSASA